MSPARGAALVLAVFLLMASLARAENFQPHPRTQVTLFAMPVVLPDAFMFRATLSRSLNLPAPDAPRRFELPPADDGFSTPAPGAAGPHKFSLPRVRVLYPRDNLCYYSRSYRYRRASRDSDVTVPAGYTTCTPRSKFQVKTTAP